MSSDEREEQGMEQPAGQGEGAELSEVLEGGEENFVAEETKPGNRNTIVLFGIIIAALGGYYLMYVRAGPQTARAATPEAAAADKTIQGFLSSGNANIKLMQEMLRNTQKVVEQFRSYPSMTQVPLNDLKTNPFKYLGGKSAEDDGTGAARQRQQDRQAALKAVQALQLQSIVHGSRKACMINNAMYTEGQQVDTFTIEKINPDGVIVRSGPFRFRVAMQK